MKKLMIVGLVALAAVTTQAGVLSNLRAALAAKLASYTAPTYSYTYNTTKTSAVKASAAVDYMEMSADEIAEVMMKTKGKKARSKLLNALMKALNSWSPKTKVGEAIKKASRGVLSALNKADIAIAEHWNKYVVPTVKEAWQKIREFFGGKKKEVPSVDPVQEKEIQEKEILKKEVLEKEYAKEAVVAEVEIIEAK